MRKFWFVPILVLAFFLFRNQDGVGSPTVVRTPTYSILPALTPGIEQTSMLDMLTTLPATPLPIPTIEEAVETQPLSTATTDQPDTTDIQTPSPLDLLPTATSMAPPTIPMPKATDPPALKPEVAPPTPHPSPNIAEHPGQPVELRIPDIDLDLKPLSVGLDPQRVPIVPKHDVGWYNRSALPGQGSNIVFWGHVLRWLDSPSVPAPFVRLHELRPGASIIIIKTGEREYRYRVTQQIQVRPENVEYILPTSTERVTLVSCIGDKVIVQGTLSKEYRLITIAEPIPNS